MSIHSVNGVLSRFRLFLESSFSHIAPIYARNENEEDLRAAWLQANWELLVECVLCWGPPPEFLVEYGGGADLYGVSSRILLPDAVATHKITVHPIGNNNAQVINLLDNKFIHLDDPELNLDFDSFCYSHRGYYYPFQAPLNSVLLEGKNHYSVAVSLEHVTFKKTPIKPE
ncbi:MULTISPECIES: hypothetical protein [Candidatus Cardinium]|uniref:hypothetical protein n=1 Tax=Candidatus Cardinium TaxID=273135 RepID=UPI001FA955EB|nr:MULTISPECIES: hypothetical protein [Cardinium]